MRQFQLFQWSVVKANETQKVRCMVRCIQYCTVTQWQYILPPASPLVVLLAWEPQAKATLFSEISQDFKRFSSLDSLAKSSFLMTTVFLCFFMLLHFSAWPLWWLLQSEPVVPARHYNVLHNGDILHYQSLPRQLSPSHTKSHWTNWAAHLLDLFA